jgi:hypothetical protein
LFKIGPQIGGRYRQVVVSSGLTVSFEIVAQESILPDFDFFPIFAIKLGHFKAQPIFSYATNTQAYQQKTLEIFILQRKKFDSSSFIPVQMTNFNVGL